ncbi:MAG: hypothetical protein ACJ0F0_02075 [Burkholderiaceae bacterium]
MLVTPDLVNAVAKINPIFLEGTLKIAAPEAKALGLKDGQIVQAVIENRGERTKLIINNKEFDLPKNAQQATDTKFQAKISIGPKSALLIPTGLIPNTSGTGLATNPTGFTPISPHLMNLLLHSGGLVNLQQLFNVNGGLANLINVSGLADLITRLLGARPSISQINSSTIRDMILSSGLFTEMRLAQKQNVHPLDQKNILYQISRIMGERGLDASNINRAILDIESSQLESQQSMNNRELSFSLLLPFKDFGSVNLSFFRKAPTRSDPKPSYTFNLHTKNELIGEVWLRTVVEKEISLKMTMWALRTEISDKAKNSTKQLGDLLENAGLKIDSFEIFNSARPGKTKDHQPSKLKPLSGSFGSVVDIEA